MINFSSIYPQISLFEGIKPDETIEMMKCLQAQLRSVKKGEVIFMAGMPVRFVGIVLDGGVEVAREDAAGNRNVLASLGPTDVFGETFACAGLPQSPVTVIAEHDSVIMQIDFSKIITTCHHGCSYHNRLIENMLKLMARKNLALSDKIYCIGHRTMQEKIEAFLQTRMFAAGKNPFDIPFSRAGMADYLCVDRSALSATLSRMQQEGLIRYHKNQFELLSMETIE